MIGCGFLKVFPVKLRNMGRWVVKLLVGKINFLWCSLPDSDSFGPDSDSLGPDSDLLGPDSNSLENDFPPGGLLYIIGDFHITWGIFT